MKFDTKISGKILHFISTQLEKVLCSPHQDNLLNYYQSCDTLPTVNKTYRVSFGYDTLFKHLDQLL